MGDANSATVLPLVPGLRSTYYDQMTKSHFRRGQLLERMSLGKLTSSEKASMLPEGNFASGAKSENNRPTTTTQATYTAPVHIGTESVSSRYQKIDSTEKPNWLTHDRLVLRFFAYFIEPVELADGQTEKRIRRVVVYFYLCDRSISIYEPRVANSGISQGEFLRPTIVSKSESMNRLLPGESISDDFYSPEDFRIGGKFCLYGRTFYIVDCDAATRNFYADTLGEMLGTGLKYPDESSSEVKNFKNQRDRRTRALDANKVEVSRKFHTLSQKVLRFYVSWYDNHLLYPETRYFVLHYYLVDDTVEIVELRDSNRERDRGRFNVLLSRRKLPRESATGRPQETNDDKEASSFIADEDLRCGQCVNVFSRRMLLEDCDPFTRDYYLKTYGVTQEKCAPLSSKSASKRKLYQAKKLPTASNNRGTSGYSTNNNNGSMQGGLVAPIPGSFSNERSIVTPVCRDDDLVGKQLRFRARFPHDVKNQREFVVTYFLEDETIAVFEPRVRNSGVLGGRYLDRGRYRKDPKLVQDSISQQSPAVLHYHASDMYVGAQLTFDFSPSQQLKLIEADLQTLNFCEGHPKLFPFSDISAVLAHVAKLWMSSAHRLDLRREWRDLDQSRSHFVSTEDMKKVLDRAEITSGLNEHQVITLNRRFENDRTGGNNQNSAQLFAYDNFCDTLSSVVSKSLSHDNAVCSIKCKLIRFPRFRQLLAYAGSSDDFISISDLMRVVNDLSESLSKLEADELITRFAASNGQVDIHRLCDYVFELPTDLHEAVSFNAIDFSLNPTSTSEGDEGIPSGSGHSTKWMPSRAGTISIPTQSDHEDNQTIFSLQSPVDQRVFSLLQRVFAARKYQLRKALRDRDVEKNGLLGEDEFMDAFLSVAPQLSDEDSYLLADSFFPANNCYVDYTHLLDSAFRS